MFDGDLSTQSYSAPVGGGGGNNEVTVTFSGLTANNKVRAYFYTGNTDCNWEINDVDISALHPNPGVGDTAQWVDLSSGFSFPVSINRLKGADSSQGGMFVSRSTGSPG